MSFDRFIRDKYQFLVDRDSLNPEDITDILDGLNALGIPITSQLAKFYLKYKPHLVGGRHINELLDPSSSNNEILFQTTYAENVLDIPVGFLSITNDEGEGMILYEKLTEKVYNVSYDDIDKLISGELEATWINFYAFLEYYYSFEDSNQKV
ncbi:MULTISPECIES: hypothetical protein [Acinetobacter]|uniref:SMI1/KNR4 family protein n=1 Tax=Acinetobacter higginsii TaxID=70347 RepID=N9T3P9_9GAMM|nr:MULTISPECIES: hypothetical protein [Acinetobacter]ENX57970.1 hypothetical protein F902_02370 [Acinetobacter higginsii]